MKNSTFAAVLLICLGLSIFGVVCAQDDSGSNQAMCFMIQTMIQNFDSSAGQLSNLIMLRTMFTDEQIAGCGMECLCAVETTVLGGE